MEVNENMKKTTLFIIIGLLIIGVALPFTYILFEDYRPAIGDFFGGLSQSATVLFSGFSTQFMQLPYWPAIFGVICLLTGIIIDRWAWGIMLGLRKKLVVTARQESGLTTYQNEPDYQQSTSNQPPPKPEVKELEA